MDIYLNHTITLVVDMSCQPIWEAVELETTLVVEVVDIAIAPLVVMVEMEVEVEVVDLI